MARKNAKAVKKMVVRKAYSFEEARQFEIRYWRKAGPSKRFSAAWLMIEEFRKIRGARGNLPRLRRTVQNIERLKIS